jgi:hypothetical protein
MDAAEIEGAILMNSDPKRDTPFFTSIDTRINLFDGACKNSNCSQWCYMSKEIFSERANPEHHYCNWCYNNLIRQSNRY